MVRISKLYTKSGDDGSTSLLGSQRVSKAHLRVEAYGTVDELNSWIGMILVRCEDLPLKEQDDIKNLLIDIQQALFDIGAELATPADSEWKPPSIVGENDIKSLEDQIDSWTASVPPLKSFVLPGGTEIVSRIHIARTVCRRAERVIVALNSKEPLRDSLIIYINRLSDWLFALSRYSTLAQGSAEHLWDAQRKKDS